MRGDELRLRQGLTNLLVNATTHGASTKGVAVTLSSDDNGSKVTIADRGPGIPPALQGQLFAPFASGATDVPGLGLGLYLARETMIEHGRDAHRRASNRRRHRGNDHAAASGSRPRVDGRGRKRGTAS